MGHMQEFSIRQIAIRDPYWSPRLETNAARAIWHQWDQLEASGCIDNFRIAAGEKAGWREGWFFADSDAYKWLDAAARVYIHHPDSKLAGRMEEFLGLVARAQTADGYLFTYNQIHFPGVRWVNLQIEHELYCHGHLIEACLSHHEAAGSAESLRVAEAAADLLVREFLGKGPEWTTGHEEIEIALLRLFRLTGEESYLNLARQFLERRGRTPFFALSFLRQYLGSQKRGSIIQRRRRDYLAAHPGYAPFRLPPPNQAKEPAGTKVRWLAGALTGGYFQQHAPIRKQTVPMGHAVRFGYLQTAAAMLDRLAPEAGLLSALERSWERMVSRRMYVTGGLGSLPGMEGFGRDYELDPEFAYAETCAALAGIFWNWEMALATSEAKYSDLLEWQLYNAASVGMGLDRTSYLYNNPLACRGGVTRRPWFGVPCCPSNLSRTWADLAKYVFSTDRKGFWIHQYIGCEGPVEAKGPLGVKIESGLPFDGTAAIRLIPETPVEFPLHIRLPSWSKETAVAVNGEPWEAPPSTAAFAPTAQGYDPRPARFLALNRLWSPGDVVSVRFDMGIALRRAHPRVKGHRGKAAVTRGPLVYCLESVDNPGIDLFDCQADPSSLRAEPAPELLGGIHVLRGTTGDGRPLCFIPYALWGNRGESQMNVWVGAGAAGSA
ncbi:MAG: glycoside hydrolase family 127 protein [Anaerolineales bacterium]|nr:glycoside hydrolase family 127 protein [Anaerolineales bacterium]